MLGGTLNNKVTLSGTFLYQGAYEGGRTFGDSSTLKVSKTIVMCSTNASATASENTTTPTYKGVIPDIYFSPVRDPDGSTYPSTSTQFCRSGCLLFPATTAFDFTTT